MISDWQQLPDLIPPQPVAVDCRRQQQAWLLECLQENKNTDYGRQHNFDRIASMESFRDTVPLVSYEDIRPYIERIAAGATDVLFSGKPLAFERTSGSSGREKLIPYSQHSLRDFQRAVLPWLCHLPQQYAISTGTAYWAVSPAGRQAETTSGGIPIGMSDAAYLGEALLPFFAHCSAVPPQVGEVSDIRDWQLLSLYYLVTRQDLVLVSVWSPTFFLLLLEALDHLYQPLQTLLDEGGTLAGHTMAADPAAVECLHNYHENRDTRILWPNLQLISCWAAGASQPFYHTLQQRFPHVAFQAKGLLSTEGVVTVPNDDNQPVLTVNSGFYEFLTADGRSLFAHELTTGDEYEVVMTTAGGLYRYRTGDLVRCGGYTNGLPILHFMGRGNLTSDLVGEKLHEAFVAGCLEGINGFRMVMPRLQGKPGYLLILDRKIHHTNAAVVEKVEQALAANPHYAYARKLGQLSALQPLLLDEPLSAFINSPVHRETRLGDIKVPALCVKTAWLDDILESVA